MGGDDGKLAELNGKGEVAVLATDPKRRWIDNVALHPDGAVAWSAGKTAFVRSGKGEDKTFDMPSTVGGLAFAPKGLRVAVAHYNGVTLWFPNMAASPEFLEWAGSHLGVVFSPDNKFLVTTMHEPALHGWRLADNRHMRMSGYPGRVKSMSWSAGGKSLATSGADAVIVWPFASKDGPMGKEPSMLAPLQARVAVVACHPKQDILAAGYSDGTILMVRLEDGAEILVRSNGTAEVAALAWKAKATPPTQSSPPENQNKPAESKPGGERPTTPPPEPARPDTQPQTQGAPPVLPPAPAEKIAPPIKEK